jgi:hypothetical protein
MTSGPDRIVFDAEPLIAHADDECGASVVERHLNGVADGDVDGFVNRVNLTEIRYTIARKYDRSIADEYVDWVEDVGIDDYLGSEEDPRGERTGLAGFAETLGLKCPINYLIRNVAVIKTVIMI